MTFRVDDALSDQLVDLAKRAGLLTMEVYATDFEVREKSDKSPVTQADEMSEALILSELVELTPDIPIVAEEDYAAGNRVDISGGLFWVVDALDGTKEFLKRSGEFTVNIGLISDGQPIYGVVHVPASGTTYWGGDAGAFREDENGSPVPITAALPADDGMIVLTSRSHRTGEAEFLENIKVKLELHSGSSIKFCLIAAGEADIYPRLGPTCEWDTGAGHGVLAAAGGSVSNMDGSPFLYGKPNFLNPNFVARGRLP